MLVSIDPGKAGAYAVFTNEGDLMHTAKVRVPAGKRFFNILEIGELGEVLTFGNTFDPHGPRQVVMEGLLDRHMPQQSAVATNTTAVNWGIQYSSCLTRGYQVDIVRPVTWKTKMGLSGKDKSASVELARELVDPAFLRKPRMRVDNVDIAEAILIGIYYGRKELGWTI